MAEEPGAATSIDPMECEPFVSPPKFDPSRSLYVAGVRANFEEVVAVDGDTYVFTDEPLIRREAEFVLANVVTEANKDKATSLGLDKTDVVTKLYERSIAEQDKFPEETKYLAGHAFGLLSKKGVVSKKLPPGMVMTEKKGTRTVTYEDGSLGRQDVVVRYATTLASEAAETRQASALKAALKSMDLVTNETDFLMREFPSEAALFADKLATAAIQAVAAASEAMEKVGLQLTAPEVKRLTSGKSAAKVA